MSACLNEPATAAHATGVTTRAPPYAQRLESHPWFEAGVPMGGASAWGLMQQRARGPAAWVNPAPYCIYVHVPFCASICSFCALYTRAVPGNADAVFDAYVEGLCEGIVRHPQAGLGVGPTTVHFGGGTPLHLGFDRLTQVVTTLREAFGNPPNCEWALETTTSSLQGETVEALADLHIDRIHLGIQTLDDRLRQRLGRQESGDVALGRMQALLQQGFKCSADLIVGFEDSTPQIVLDDLRRLYDVGIRMFSICELRLRKEPSTRSGQRQQRACTPFALWQNIWDFMADVGLRPIHLGQFARSQQDNLYYTHPARDEDCVALGPYAHGSCGRLHYANKLAPGYHEALAAAASPIDTAVLYDDRLQTVCDLERELLAHDVRPATLRAMAAAYPRFESLFSHWRRGGLLVDGPRGGGSTLSAMGSWYVGNMIDEARGLAR